MAITKHMGAAKSAVIQWIKNYGVKDVLPDFVGSEAEAIAAVEADPREVFCSCKCEKEPSGACSGKGS